MTASTCRGRRFTIDTVFVDTNVFIYAIDNSDPRKQQAASDWETALWRTRSGRTSYQVLQELYAQVIRKWPGAKDQVRADIGNLLMWDPVVVDAIAIGRAWKIQDRYGFSFWDALVIAAAKTSSSKYLLTEDLQDGQVVDGVQVLSPFARHPSALGF